MTAFIVVWNCGDYYCGCPGGAGGSAWHIEGVYLQRAEAERVAATIEGDSKESSVIEVTLS